jgi:hypothetical protein
MAGARLKKEEQAKKLLEQKRLLLEKKNGVKQEPVTPPVEKPVDKSTVKPEPPKVEPIKPKDVPEPGQAAEPIPEPIKKDKNAIIDPLNESKTIQREHSTFQPNIVGNVADVEELQLDPPVIDFNKQETIEMEVEHNDGPNPAGEHEQPEPEKPDRGTIHNPAMDDLSPKQKAASAEYLAEQTIIAYKTLNNFGKDFVKFDEGKQQLKAIKGEFDFAVLSMRIPISETTNETISIKEYLDTINNQADQIFVVTEEFEEKVRPLLIQIYKEHGWGMTPLQQLIAYGVEDAAPKIAGIVAIKSSINQLLSISMQILDNMNKPKPGATVIVKEAPDTDNISNENEIKQGPKVEKVNKPEKEETGVEPGEKTKK